MTRAGTDLNTGEPFNPMAVALDAAAVGAGDQLAEGRQVWQSRLGMPSRTRPGRLRWLASYSRW